MAQSIAAEVLQEARKHASLSQAELADAAGTYQSVIGRIEAGKSSPSLETLSRLVKAAGFDLRLSLDPSEFVDPVIEAYKPGVDQTLLISNLRQSVNDRVRANINLNAAFEEMDRERGRRPPERR